MLQSPIILILAAGQSRRMRGADKLLACIDGTAQLRRAAEAALNSGHRVWVALPPDRPARFEALAGLALERLVVDDAGEGMSATLRAGNAAVPPDAPLLLLLADLPEITTADLQQMTAAHRAEPGMILRATNAAGQPGHPVLFPVWARQKLHRLTGDSGARDMLRQHQAQVRTVALPDNHATTDLDTPEDWDTWRAARVTPR